MKRDNFVDAFEESIKNNWNSIAVSDIKNRRCIQYRELAEDINILHNIWADLCLGEGEKIAICAGNCYEWIELYVAIVTSGRIAVILPNNLSESEIIQFVSHSHTSILYCGNDIICDREGLCSISNLKLVIDIRSKEIIEGSQALVDKYYASVRNHYRCNDGTFNMNDVAYPKLNCDGTHLILYTSGSTGMPKGVMQSRRFSMVNVSKILNRYCPEVGESIICINPFHHVFSQGTDIGPALCSGMQMVIVDDLSPQNLLRIFSEYHPKRICASPIILIQLLQFISKEYRTDLLSSDFYFLFGNELRAFITGGASLPKEIEEELIMKYNFPIHYVYGSTECGILSIGYSSQRGSSGTVVEENTIRIATLSSTHYFGEIQVNQNNIFSGYYNAPEVTKSAYTEDGWFKTGDLGYIDEDGNLFITGRCKDMLLTSNGENIYPEKIEETMNASLYIRESILVQRGEKLYAIVVPDREKAEADGLDAQGLNKKIDEVVREASKKLPGFTIISGFELRDEPLERTPKGSLKRYLYS